MADSLCLEYLQHVVSTCVTIILPDTICPMDSIQRRDKCAQICNLHMPMLMVA